MVLRKSGRVDSRRFRVTDSKQMKGINRKVGSFFMFAQHERILTGVSPQCTLTTGSIQRMTRVSIVRWNLKEVSSKHLV